MIDNKTKPISPYEHTGDHIDFKQNVEKNTDQLQESFKCCGFHRPQEWIESYDGFIPASCCERESIRQTVKAGDKPEWQRLWPSLSKDFEIKYCESAYIQELVGCREAFHEFEEDKQDRLALLTAILGVLCLADCFISLLSYALIQAEHECKFDETEMTVISDTDSNDQPAGIIAMKPRSSIASNSGGANEIIAARAMAVRFNLSNSPRNSISGPPSKFSLAARRQSSYI